MQYNKSETQWIIYRFYWSDKKKTISLINDHDKCFQYDVTAELNHDEIGKNSQRI